MRSVLLIGLGRFGKHIAMKLNDMDYQVMAVDHDEERVNGVLSFVTNAQIGDSTSQEFLSSLGIRNYDVCIVTIGDDFQSSLETVSLLSELGAKKVIARASRGVQENSCCATVRMRWFTRKSSSRPGRRSAVPQITSWIIFNWTVSVPSMNSPFPTTGTAKPSWNWISARNTASIYWASGKGAS